MLLYYYRDYLASRPLPQSKFEESVVVRTEMERLAAGKPMEPFNASR